MIGCMFVAILSMRIRGALPSDSHFQERYQGQLQSLHDRAHKRMETRQESGSSSSAAQKKTRVGIALCGFGRAGKIHFHSIRQNHRCIFKYVVDLGEALGSVQKYLEEYNLSEKTRAVSTEDFEKVVLGDIEVDAVLIATPTETHERYVLTSLRAGCAVFCEKPLAADIASVAACYDEAERLNKPLFCAFNRRFDPGMSAIHRQVKEGKVGKIYQIKTCSRDSPLPPISFLKISDGMYHDCAVHDIDMICWIVGEVPVGVMAQGTTFNSEIKALNDVDTIAIILKFPSGVLGSIDLSRHSSYGYDQRLEVLGEKGMLQVENIHKDPVQCSSSNGITSSTYLHSFPDRYKQAYHRELDHFVDVILDPSIPLSVTKEQTLLSSRIAEACEVSAKEGRMVEIAAALKN